MKPITDAAAVSCYVDAAAFLAMIILVLVSRHFQKRTNPTVRIYQLLCLCIMAICVLPFIHNAMYMQTAPWCHDAAFIAKTLRECLIPVIISLWLLFIYRRLYRRKRPRPFVSMLVFLPFAVIELLLVINLFTGILFTYSATNKFEPRPLLYVIFIIEYIYFCSSAAIVGYYDKKERKLRFLRISPMLVSVTLASGTQFFTPYDIGILGYVSGIILLYYSMSISLHFMDTESELYNREYLAYLMSMAAAGTYNAQSALILDAEGDPQTVFRILRRELHRSGDVIRVEEGTYLMFSDSESRSTMGYLSSLVEEAADRHNAEHPDKKVHFTVHCRMRTGSEDTYTFLRTVMNKEEAGGEMRGIVSMISELDRLDKKLKLASDIQTSMLPTSFPAFPDRTEFDLYASMTPAREVGGDFYDFFLVDSDHLALVIADVSDKDIPAALFMMVSKSLIKNQLTSGCGPAEALERVNLQLCEHNASMMFVTVWLAVLEISTGKGVACNAGHENPCVRRSEGDFEILKYKHNMFLGVNKKAKYDVREFEMSPGDCLFVYTDGVTEATNTSGELFGENRLAEALNQIPDANPAELIRHVHAEVDRFADSAPQFDDITMLCVKYFGSTG